MYLADRTLGIKSQALMVLEALAAREPDFAKYKNGRYVDIWIETFAFYNGRERSIGVKVQRTLASSLPSNALYIVWGECRCSDGIFVDTWEGSNGINPPTVADFPEAAYKARCTFNFGRVDEVVAHIYAHMENYYRTLDEKKAVNQ